MKVHLFIANKGGCGKSFAAWTYIQYRRSQGADLTVFDCDANQTLCKCRALQAVPLELGTDDSGAVNLDVIDAIVEQLSDIDERPAGEALFDLGASTAYKNGRLVMEMVLPAFPQAEIMLHLPLTAPDFDDNIASARELHASFPQAQLVLWLSPYFSYASDTPIFPEGTGPAEYGLEGARLVQLPDTRHSMRARVMTMLYTAKGAKESYAFDDFGEGRPNPPAFGRPTRTADWKFVSDLRQDHFAALAAGGL